ncbi:MAG TPA: choice-of-anchor Q domain-containing protein [Pyrinomonadaceae bacterium]|nr:choice-of-anchor Q domain-containing protein [Pyrinomonadaceae bacterium]
MAICSWTGAGGDGQWSTSTNWTGCTGGGAPAVNDFVFVDNAFVAGSYTVTLPSGATTVSIAKLQISANTGNTVTVVLPSTNTGIPGFSVGDNTSATDDIIINSGGVLKNSSGAASGDGIDVNTTGNGTARINNGGRYVHNTARSTAGIVPRLSTVAGTEIGVFEYDSPGTGSIAISASGMNYGSLTLTRTAGAATYTSTGGSALTIRGNFQINSGVTYSSSMTAAMNLAGDLTNNGASTLSLPSGQPVVFNGSSTQIVSGSNPIVIAGTATVNSGATVNFSGASAITLAGATTVNSGGTVNLSRNVTGPNATFLLNGTLNCGANVLSSNGTFTSTPTATLSLGSTDGITVGPPFPTPPPGNIQTTNRNFGSGSSYIYNGTSAQVTGNGLPTTLTGALTISNTSGVTLSQSTTLNAASSIATGATFNTGAFALTVGNTLTNSGTLNVSNNGTIKGTGTVSGPVSVNSGGTVAPGSSAGILNTGNVSFSSGSTHSVEIGGATAGTQYDQLNVTGTVSLGGATLSLTRLNSYTPNVGQTFTIINNDDTDAVSGTFNGLIQGATITDFLGTGQNATISYTGGDGNDVILTVSCPGPAGFTVNDSGDASDANTGDGLCATAGSVCTLRAAIEEANALSSCAGSIQINFAGGLSGGTITLSSGSEIQILHNVTINGLGANLLTIDGGSGTNRIFYLGAVTVAISGVTMQNGHGGGTGIDGVGGAIHAGTVGGGGTLVLDSVVVQNNTASGSSGGVYYGLGANHRIINSTFTGNSSLGCGGFFKSSSSSLYMVNSTISNNSVTNSGLAGGGFCDYGSGMVVRNSTITNNHANSGWGGGILRNGSTLNIGNTIVAGNTAALGPDFFGSGSMTSAGYNLIGDNSQVTGTFPTGAPNGNNDWVGSAGSLMDPLLGALTNNGGPTTTHALLAGSPAIDHGNNALAVDPFNSSTLSFDQRGSGFSRTQGDAVDIGAYESAFTTAPVISYTALANANNTSNRTLSITVTDSSGVPTSGTGLPRIYLRKGTSGSYSSNQ